MKYITTICFLLITIVPVEAQKIDIIKTLSHAESQTEIMLRNVKEVINPANPTLISPRTLENDKLKVVSSRDWTSGFFPGLLWYLYELTGNEKWKAEAKTFTSYIEREKTNNGNHDIGFKVYCSFGNGYRLTKDTSYKAIIIQSAKTLSTRFNPKTGVIRSWDHNRDKWVNPVIIDNMLNLELLFEATRLSGDSFFHKIAVSHANTTMKNHFRPDFSTYHVLDYDPETGAVLKKNTHQGYSHESAWARGQAWGLYGYTLCYRYTKDVSYLKLAEKIAGFILNHPNMPEDLVPYWDFNAPNIPNEPRDASAAAVISSALYELSSYSTGKNNYLVKADAILYSLANKYISPWGEAKGFILLHSTGSKPSNSEVDVPLSYADYYYLEAVLRRSKLQKKNL
jgi:rhamnogalacturonyl hydrolase YesR